MAAKRKQMDSPLSLLTRLVTEQGEARARLVLRRELDRASQPIIEAARKEHATDDREIDDDAVLSVGEEGGWVSAWVWLAGPLCSNERCRHHDQPLPLDATVCPSCEKKVSL